LPDWAHSINDTLFRFVTRGTVEGHLMAFVPLGLVCGIAAAYWSARLVSRESGGKRKLGLPACLAISVAASVLFPGLVVAVIHGRCQWLTEGGSIDWAQWRMPYYFMLLTLMIVATAIDFDQYLIPDDITGVGVLIGVVWSTAIGNMQLVPAWIDWNQVHPIFGPYIPEWIREHPHWHGLVFSLAGLLTGAGLTWLARVIARGVLGVEALGFGDVTLMGMIGSFLGWQPVVFVFLLAPMCALVIGLSCKLLYGRRAVPYGPYLCAAAVIVLFTWRWLWIPSREVFGHWPTLAAFAALLLAGLAILLGLLRLYRAIPVTRRTGQLPGSGNAAPPVLVKEEVKLPEDLSGQPISMRRPDCDDS
jgi:leader peptidase (prepilin peptidase)/N-methyltransferase